MKKISIAVVALTIALVGASVVNAAFTRNLSVGSTGADVAELQTLLMSRGHNIPALAAGTAPGYFGSQTLAAVKAYQLANGVPSTGFVGPLTLAKLNGSATGPTAMVLPFPCPVGYVVPTGWVCPGTTTTTTTTGPLAGGAGDITVSVKNSGTVDTVLEGQSDAKIAGFEVKAEGSDVAVTSVRVELNRSGSTGSNRLNRYLNDVKIMLDGRVVGSANVADFTESSDVYSRNIPVSGVVVRNNSTSKFFVAASSVNNVDSNDLDASWRVEIGQIRFSDSTGVVLTHTPSNDVVVNTFSFDDLSSSGDIQLRVTEDVNSINETHVVRIDDSSDTNNVAILSFALDAKGSNIALNTMKFTVTAGTAGVTEIANDFRLMKGSSEVGTVTIDKDCDGGSDGFASTSDTSICVVVSNMDDDDVVISKDSRVPFTLVADINDTDGGFVSGDVLSVSLSASEITDAEDANGDVVVSGDRTGSANSTNIQMLAAGIAVKQVSQSATVDTKVSDVATDDNGVFTSTFEVTAIENDAYIELGSATRGTTESNTGANFTIQDQPNNYAATTTGTISLADLTHVSGGSVSGEFIKIGAGNTATFKLTVTFDPAQTTGSSVGYRMRLYSVNSATTAVDATAQQVLSPEVNYRTGAVSVGN
jgi:hypothetical protein